MYHGEGWEQDRSSVFPLRSSPATVLPNPSVLAANVFFFPWFSSAPLPFINLDLMYSSCWPAFSSVFLTYKLGLYFQHCLDSHSLILQILSICAPTLPFWHCENRSEWQCVPFPCFKVSSLLEGFPPAWCYTDLILHRLDLTPSLLCIYGLLFPK